MTTYQDQFSKLRKEFAEASDKFLKKDKEITANTTFGDSIEMAQYLDLQKKWRKAQSEYFEFNAIVQQTGAKPDDIYPEVN
jgi:hypothetical protein